jgi:DNA repair exonuclease SbcCD ATPase subunit
MKFKTKIYEIQTYLLQKFKSMKGKQIFQIVAIVLAILLLLAAWWGMGLRNQKNELTQKNEQLAEELGDLSELKNNLEQEVDSLEIAYFSLAEENEGLKGSVADAQQTIKAKQAAIRKIKRQSASEITSLRGEIEQLLSVKDELEFSIQNLQEENDSLRIVTGQLTEDLGQAKQENEALANLNQTIQEELKRLTLLNFKAGAFRVEVERRKSKATAKSKQAKRILVSFDLTDVPPKYQGIRPLYMVITDDKGTPIKNSSPIEVQVNVNGQNMDIQAVKSKEINIEANQRLSFSYDLEEKLRTGFYRVAVYTDIGLLGASSFRLR